jgi:hypothetical protein
MHDAIYTALALYAACEDSEFHGAAVAQAAREVPTDAAVAMAAIARERGLQARDDAADRLLADAFAALPKAGRRTMLLAYLGFPFYDIATLPLLQGDSADEYDPVKVDRISPEDCSAIRAGGAEATLKGIEFNNFGAFFSRVYRENDYLWGRLHGVERLLDIVISAMPAATRLSPDRIAAYRRAAFLAILDEEESRLTHVADLIASLREEIGCARAARARFPDGPAAIR